MFTSRSMNSYMRCLRSVTFAPMAMPSRNLKVAMDFRALCDHRPLPGDEPEIGGGGRDLLMVADPLAHAHIQHDLVEPRHLHRVGIAELLGELLAHHVLIVLLEPRRIGVFLLLSHR